MKKMIFLSLMSLFLVACGGSGSNTGGNNQNSELAGTDSNNNGVRDDIDTIITGFSALTIEQQSATTKFAKLLQTSITSDNSNTDTARNNLIAMQKMQECMALRIPNSEYEQYAQEIEAQTLNSEARIVAYINFEKSLNGQIIDVGFSDNPCGE